ncbi:matrixin family metalloprotease [Patescibacteria group bacterium]
MKRLFKIVVLLSLILTITLIYPKIKVYTNRWANFSFCDEPILYKVGVIDPKFNVTREQVINDTLQAIELWNNIQKKELFKLDPNASLVIDLVYDERQENLKTISQQKDVIEKQKDDLSTQAYTFETKKADIEIKLDNLNKEIEQWNQKGGAPKNVYDDIKNRQSALQNEINDINSKADRLNQTTDRINGEIDNLNDNVSEFNNLLSIKPEEGLYIGSKNKIEIYIYDSKKNFVHTVAHELGHALGLDHVDEKDSILYPTASPNSHASMSDIDALRNYCAEQNRLELIKNDLKNSFLMFFAQFQDVVT